MATLKKIVIPVFLGWEKEELGGGGRKLIPRLLRRVCMYPEEKKLFCSPFSKMGSDSPHFRLKGGGEIDLLGVSYLPPPFNFPTFGRRCGGNIYRLGYPPPFPPPPLPRPNFYFHPLRHLLLLLDSFGGGRRGGELRFPITVYPQRRFRRIFLHGEEEGGDMGKGSEEEGFFLAPTSSHRNFFFSFSHAPPPPSKIFSFIPAPSFP